MREIIFRGKRTDNKQWVEGFYALIGEENPNAYIITNKGRRIRVAHKSISQQTGLTDKNGTKIFEGDCWLDTDGDYIVYVVEFRDGQFGFACYGWQGALMPYGFDEDAGGWGEIEFEPMTNFIIKNIEIIGNIHDNPELLKGGAE